MAKNVQNSNFSLTRIFILAESTQLRSSPLHEAAERYTTFSKKSCLNENLSNEYLSLTLVSKRV
jgi:hypothetical protein